MVIFLQGRSAQTGQSPVRRLIRFILYIHAAVLAWSGLFAKPGLRSLRSLRKKVFRERWGGRLKGLEFRCAAGHGAGSPQREEHYLLGTKEPAGAF